MGYGFTTHARHKIKYNPNRMHPGDKGLNSTYKRVKIRQVRIRKVEPRYSRLKIDSSSIQASVERQPKYPRSTKSQSPSTSNHPYRRKAGGIGSVSTLLRNSTTQGKHVITKQ